MSKIEGRPMQVEIASAGIRRNARVLETQRRSKANQFTDDLFIIDQHASDEKFLYEKFWASCSLNQ